MKRIPRFVALGLFALACNGCVYARIFYYNTPTLAAPRYFDSRPVRAFRSPSPLRNAEKPFAFSTTRSRHDSYRSFDELLESNQTRAFLVVHERTVVYERYFRGFSASSLLPAFSASKSYAATLVGCALADGLFASVRDPITKYLPELAQRPGYEEVTLEHLLRMTSGIDFEEESTSGAALYYSTDLHERTVSYDLVRRPGERYVYGSVNLQLLGLALERALHGETLAHYFQRRLWQPLGPQYEATWSLDSAEGGLEKFFAGFNAVARDHALLGVLYLAHGDLDGRVIVPRSFLELALSPDPIAGVVQIADGAVRRGHYQWFLTPDLRGYFAKGYHGQYIFVVPEKNAVFVRFGEGYGDVDWPALFFELAATL